MWPYIKWHAYIHTYNQRVVSWLEKKMAASSGLSCPGQNIPWEYTSLLVFILYLLSAHNLASHLFCLQRKNVLVTTTGAWWSLWQFWLFLSTQSPFSCTCVPREFSEHGSDSLGVFNFETLPCWGFWTWWVKNKHHHQQNPFLGELTKNSWHVACWSPENIPILPLTLQNSVGMLWFNKNIYFFNQMVKSTLNVDVALQWAMLKWLRGIPGVHHQWWACSDARRQAIYCLIKNWLTAMIKRRNSRIQQKFTVRNVLSRP